jgi:hypothetical protein
LSKKIAFFCKKTNIFFACQDASFWVNSALLCPRRWHCRLTLSSGLPIDTGNERKAFLSLPEKRIVFHFTPTHASWLNQIEIWFSVLTRKVIQQGNFTSVAGPEHKIIAFIDNYNKHLAKPYKWTYT